MKNKNIQLLPLLEKFKIQIMMIIAFGFWIFCMRGFVFNKLTFLKDALSYYNHTKFFIDNMAKGILPLWDPTWNCGSPNEFFLRRIGMYNPFYYGLIFLVKTGVPYTQAYISFIVSYYFLGLIGFYLVTHSFLKDKISAFTAFCLLLFSSQGTLVFSSFIFLIFTPMIWFFYFLIQFSKKPRKYSAYGITLCLMILFSTYIPFYFLAILLSFLILFHVFFFKKIPNISLNYLNFIKKNKTLFLLCMISIIISIIPGYLFMQKAGSNDFILPSRHYESPDINTLTVKPQIIAEGGIIADAIIKRMLLYLEKFKTGVVYMPIFAYLLLLLSFVQTLNRKIALAVIWGFLFFMIGLYEASPIYPFLYKHIFFFKYFRNFQFFVWILILPLFSFICAEHLKNFFQKINNQKNKNFIINCIFITMIHLGLTIFLLTQPHIIISSFYVIFFSWITFISIILSDKKMKPSIYWLAVFLLLIIGHPIQVFNYLNKNSTLKTTAYRYDPPYMDFEYHRSFKISKSEVKESNDVKSTKMPKRVSAVYYSTSPYHVLRQSIDNAAFSLYTNNKFYVYDNVELVITTTFDLKELEQSLKKGENKAYVWSNNSSQFESLKNTQKTAQTITKSSPFLDVIKYTSNSLTMQTHFPDPKFILYTDNFFDGWNLSIDNKSATIYKSNFTFKGFFVPAGDHLIHLNFANKKTIVANYAILQLFLLIFILLVWESIHFSLKGEKS